ncbi:MAG TPA: substrate-binding domain-containing protein [Gemmatimonadaceae bacterium]|nr:substrate-binding domain-containing protein [Gemmatimonadaceae bacterium]
MTRTIVLAIVGACGIGAVAWSATHHATGSLRVCADPNNLPFSNARGEGFENRLAELIARDLGKRVEYTWWAQRRGFVRNTLNAGTCDLIVGVPEGYGMVRTTRPYYRSTYVFVTRRDRGLHINSLDDPALRTLRVGVHLIGDDYANSPAAYSLARRGMSTNVVGYTVYGDYAQPNPPARLIEAVANKDIDVAVAWGPLASYFARTSRVPLDLRPVTPPRDGPMSYVFDIAMGVRRRDSTASALMDREITRLRPRIDSVLTSYGVPLAR